MNNMPQQNRFFQTSIITNRFTPSYMKYFAILFVTTCVGISSFAQDTSRKREVTVTSTFKPSLKEAAKINFNPTPPATDTSRPILQYNVPDQNLFFSYQPGSLKPLALQSDTGS